MRFSGRSTGGGISAWLSKFPLILLAGLAGLLLTASVWATAGEQGKAANAAGLAAPIVLVLGDSLSAEYGLKRGTGWVALLQERLTQEKLPHRVVNASISGETTSGGAARIDALLAQHKPQVVIIELGGNDALRGLAMAATEQNLRRMSKAARAAGAQVLLTGMEVPPNYGARYAADFRNVFKRVAIEQKAALLPFLLDGFGQDLSAFQADRIHPSEASQQKILANVWPALQPLLARTTRK
jgi:acyl-CoA thioesterase I